MAVELSMPIGGIIPWIGDAYGIELPENYMVIDGNMLDSLLPTESPFKGKLNLISSMEGRTFHMTDLSHLQEKLGDTAAKTITLTKDNLPTSYTYSNSTGASYTQDNNTVLGTGKVGASVGSLSSGSGRKFVDVSSFSTDDTQYTVSGTGYKRIYHNAAETFYSGTYPHNHNINLSHKHDITAKASYTPPSKTTNDSFGNLGSGTAINIPTKATDLTYATCKFVIRLW